MHTQFRARLTVFIVALLAVVLIAPWTGVGAQSSPRLFEAARPGARPAERPIRPHKARKAKLRLDALDSPSVVLNLFDDTERVATRTHVLRPQSDRFVWHGRTDDGGVVTFAVVNGVATGTVFLDGRSFEVLADSDGDYTITELNAAAFPAEDAPLDASDLQADAMSEGGPVSAAAAGDGGVEIDVMVLWTPAARNAVGGTQAGIESLVLSAVANANLAYANSSANARLRLVHSAEVALVEGGIQDDLVALATSGDGRLDAVHTLRQQHGADIVTVLGSGYAGQGYCGVGYLMQTPVSSFAQHAFNVVDQSCAAGNLSYAHEVGHNQGLQHDPGSSASPPSYNYAYGYQDPGNMFRTVMSYGGAPRVPHLSNPSVLFSGRATGTSTQNNAAALNNTAPVVASFKSAGSTTTCAFSVSPASLSFANTGGTATVSVSTAAGCSWTSSSPSSWASVSGNGSGPGTATVSVTTNSSGSRSAMITVAGKNVTISQAAGATTCTYAVSATSLSFSATAESKALTVTTQAGCAWTASSAAGWASATGATTGSGTAVVSVTQNNGSARSGDATIAGTAVALNQAARAKAVGKKR